MNLRRIAVIFASLAAIGSFAGGCQSGGVGDPCTPEDEYQTDFSGFAAEELNIESRSFQCETRVCLVNHFRGRVSCPLGMNEDALAGLQNYIAQQKGQPLPNPSATCPKTAGKQYAGVTPCVLPPSDAATVCRLPGESGNSAVTVDTTVQPQCASRQAKDTVYCSCRCGGDDPNAKYCDCPGGYDCTDLSEFALGAAVAKGSGQLSGKYCIKTGTALQPGTKICPAEATVEETQADPGACTAAGNCTDDSGNKITTNP
jgi:hypothetical protein